ncbi:hypothetical protein [Microbacterium candidum]|nr:hypothetical protein [Microbacterium sp. ASV49]
MTTTAHPVPLPELRRIPAAAPARRMAWPAASSWGSIARHLMIPLFLALGMAFAYMGAFHAPAPHGMPVAVVGSGPEAQVFAQTLNDKGDGKLAVTTVASESTARRQILDQKIAAAFQVDASGATLYVSHAASEAGAATAQALFQPIAYDQHLPLQVVDVRSGTAQDPAGQSLFFLLIAITVGAYASSVAISASASKLGVLWRIGIGAAVGFVVAAAAVVIAGGVYHALNGNEWLIWLLAGLYAFGIITIGIGLHPFLRGWTTPTLTALFVMLNVTSAGGVYPSYLEPAFFAGLTTFWNGAAWLDAARMLTYFPGQSIGFDALRLSLWAVAGVALVIVGHLATRSRRVLADETIAATAEEEELVVAG